MFKRIVCSRFNYGWMCILESGINDKGVILLHKEQIYPEELQGQYQYT